MIGKRTACLVTAVCIVLTGLFAVPVMADSQTADSTTESAANITGSAAGTPSPEMISTESAIQVAGQNNNTSGAAVNTTGTSINIPGTAVNTTGTSVNTSGTAINTSGTAINTSGAAVITSGAAVASTGSAIGTTSSAIDLAENEEDLWYLPQIEMKKDHQKILWDYCKKRGIDYVDMLALIYLESNFYEKCSSGRYKGYFQISSGHFSNLAKTLKTPNKPLDGAININWGTAMYYWCLTDKRTKGLEGKKLRDVVLSLYQRGTIGYDRYGINKKYLANFYKKRDIIVSYFEEKEESQIEEKDHSE